MGDSWVDKHLEEVRVAVRDIATGYTYSTEDIEDGFAKAGGGVTCQDIALYFERVHDRAVARQTDETGDGQYSTNRIGKVLERLADDGELEQGSKDRRHHYDPSPLL